MKAHLHPETLFLVGLALAALAGFIALFGPASLGAILVAAGLGFAVWFLPFLLLPLPWEFLPWELFPSGWGPAGLIGISLIIGLALIVLGGLIIVIDAGAGA